MHRWQCTDGNAQTAMHRWQCTDDNLLMTMHRWQCTDDNVLMTMYWWQCTDGNALMTMHWWQCTDDNALMTMHWWQCTDDNAQMAMHRWQCTDDNLTLTNPGLAIRTHLTTAHKHPHSQCVSWQPLNKWENTNISAGSEAKNMMVYITCIKQHTAFKCSRYSNKETTYLYTANGFRVIHLTFLSI